MNVGHDLYREVLNFAPADLTPGEMVVALVIADHANEATRLSWISNAELCRRTRLGSSAVRKHLAQLAARSLEFRIPIAWDALSRPVFAAKGRAVNYAVPDFIAATNVSPSATGKAATDVAPMRPRRRHDQTPKAPRSGLKAATDVAPFSSVPSVTPQESLVAVDEPYGEGSKAAGSVAPNRFDWFDSNGTAPRQPPPVVPDPAEEAERQRQLNGLADFARTHPEAVP